FIFLSASPCGIRDLHSFPTRRSSDLPNDPLEGTSSTHITQDEPFRDGADALDPEERALMPTSAGAFPWLRRCHMTVGIAPGQGGSVPSVSRSPSARRCGPGWAAARGRWAPPPTPIRL